MSTEPSQDWTTRHWGKILLAAFLLVLFILFLMYKWGHWYDRRIESNESDAKRALKSLATAELDFRSYDRDGNMICDFWTGDVTGLYRFGLIPRELAEADVAPLKPLVPAPIPYRGYFFRTLLADENETGPQEYQQVTDTASGKVHHRGKFGFVAYPVKYGKTGKHTLLIDEGATVFQKDTGGRVLLHFPQAYCEPEF